MMAVPTESQTAPARGDAVLTEVAGETLTPLDEFWLATTREAAKESIKALEEAAKQLISLTTLSQGIYFAAVSFGEVKKTLDHMAGPGRWALGLLLLLPLLFWIASLAMATFVFHPEVYRTNLESPDLARATYQEVVAHKHQQLNRAHLTLMVGFVFLLINLAVYLLFVPKAN